MATVFDGPNLLITLDAPVAGVYALDVQRLYSEWKEWQIADYQNMGYPPAFRVVGGDSLTPGISAGAYYFLRNDFGWRIKTTEADQTVFSIGNLTPQDASLPILVPTTGDFTVGVFGLQPITQSVGDILSIVQQTQYGNAVYIDTIDGSPGTERPQGTAAFPVDNLADGIAIAVRESLSAFVVRGTIALTQAFTGWTFQGTGASSDVTVDLNGQNVAGSYFQGLMITGAGTGSIEAIHCHLMAVSGVGGHFERCGIHDGANGVTLGADATFLRSYSDVTGNTKPWVSMNALAINLSVRGHMGGFELRDCTNAAATISIDCDSARIALAASCSGTAGVVLGGTGHLENNSTLTNITDRREVRNFMTEAVEGTETMEEAMRLIRAAAAGKIVQQLDGSYVIRDKDDSKNRIEGELGANNSRTITLVDSS